MANELEKLFLTKQTENGDIAYKSTSNKLLDILFMTAYFEKHLDEVKIGNSDKEKLFAMFIRDGRFGLGRRDLGRELMKQAEVSAENVVKAGRFDDLIFNPTGENIELLKAEIYKDNQLAKKWSPRLNSKNRAIAQILCKMWGLSEKQYRKLIKVDTTENKLSRKRIDDIEFEKVPSLAMIKYYKRFLQEDRFAKYLESVKKGEKKLNIATTTVYDIYKNRESIDADLFFDKLEKIKINCVPVLDTSGSMYDNNDSIGKATCIAHYLAKCSTFCNGQVVSFSSQPQLLTMSNKPREIKTWYGSKYVTPYGNANNYCKELNSLYTGDCSNTDFGAVMRLFADLNEVPEYLVILSDMEFDRGSSMSKDHTMQLFKEKGYKTKIVWWNFNDRNKTVPETDEYGNIYLSGYSPYLLKFLENGFDGNKFLDKLLVEYEKKIKAN
ncbi:MAG: DUF2828 family protein [Christensenellales bacterium]